MSSRLFFLETRARMMSIRHKSANATIPVAVTRGNCSSKRGPWQQSLWRSFSLQGEVVVEFLDGSYFFWRDVILRPVGVTSSFQKSTPE
jgi:hypothetical protein